MRSTQKFTLVALLGLLAAAVIGFYLTSAPRASSTANHGISTPNASKLSLNQHYLDTVRRLASTATTSGEQHAAKAALDDASHELDLQYAYALQLASLEPAPQTSKIRSVQERIGKIKAAILTHAAEASQIKADLNRVRGARRKALEDQLDVTQAELSLLQEMLGDANDDLNQAGGNPQTRLQELKSEHIAASNAAVTFRFPALRPPARLGSLLARCSLWKSIYEKQLQIRQAQESAAAAAARLARQRGFLQKRVAAERAQSQALARHELTPDQIANMIAAGEATRTPERKTSKAAPTKPSSPSSAKPAAVNASDLAITLIHEVSTERIMLRILDHRIQVMKELASAYSAWGAVVALTGRSALHRVIAGGFWVVLLMTLAFLLSRLIERVFTSLSLERKQKSTLQAMLRISLRIVIVLVMLMVVFGKPSHLSTVLGLAGAGLAVALQDFILSFMGWFVLMGRHGIRVGDWVEINPNSFTGVRGEVIEITLFRTVLLETGNWTEPGHPTGRQVAFMNMYAVSGYYFNFSTSGQWLWDELQVAIPAGRKPYPLIERIRALVAKETQAHTVLAESEWQRVSHRYGTKLFSAEATVSVRHTNNGILAVVRYMTRADERTDLRHRLNDGITKLLHDMNDGDEPAADPETVRDTVARGPDRS